MTEDGPWASDDVTVTNGYGLRSALAITQPSSQFLVTYSWDGAGRWNEVGGTAGVFTDLYSSANAVTLPVAVLLPGGGYITNQCDNLARLTRTELRTSGGSILNAYGYQYNSAHQRTLIGRTNTALSSYNGYVLAGYDAAGQLVQAWSYQPDGTPVTSQKWTYGYDPAQNLNKRTNNTTVETFTVNVLNQLTSIPDSTPYYDRRGNLVTRNFSGGPYWTYTHDHENRLTSVATDTSYTPEASRFRVEFVYDGQSRLRIKRDYIWSGSSSSAGLEYGGVLDSGGWMLSAEVRYLYDALLIVQERSSGNTPTVTYTRGRDLSGSLDGAGGIGGLLARSHGYNSGTWTYHNFYHADGNGNVTALVNSDGTLQASYIYDPYGRYLAGTGGLASANVMRFSSKPWGPFLGSSTSGLYYYGYRFYDPYLQRWMNRDPLGEPGGINLYGCFQNAAPNFVDPLGTALSGVITDLVVKTAQCVANIGFSVWTNYCGQNGAFAPRQSTNDPSCRVAHCVANCRIKRECPGRGATAYAVSWYKEHVYPFTKEVALVIGPIEIPWYQEQWDPRDSPGDWAANKMGRVLACRSKRSCEAACEDMVARAAYFNGVQLTE